MCKTLKAGNTTSAQIKVMNNPMESRIPMDAVPSWEVNAKLLKLKIVVNAP